MGIWGDFKDLVKIVRDGGLEVVTRIDGTGRGDDTATTNVGDKQETQEGGKTYKIYDTIGIRTTIQLDADYVTMMSPQVLAMPELLIRHTGILKKKLSVLKRVHRLAWPSSLGVFLLSMATLYAQYIQSGGYPGFGLDLWSVLSLIGVAISFIMLFLNRAMWWLARLYVQRRFSLFASRLEKG